MQSTVHLNVNRIILVSSLFNWKVMLVIFMLGWKKYVDNHYEPNTPFSSPDLSLFSSIIKLTDHSNLTYSNSSKFFLKQYISANSDGIVGNIPIEARQCY